MECVTCEKCRLWGKLQILGIGTAIKILLTSNAEGQISRPGFLNRQEIVALINVLNNFAVSVDFAANAAPLELIDKLQELRRGFSLVSCLVIAVAVFMYGIYYLRVKLATAVCNRRRN